MDRKKITVISEIVLIGLLSVTLIIQSPAQSREAKKSGALIIKKLLEEKGIVTAREEFIKISSERDRYIFEESEFLALGNEYLMAGTPHMASAVFTIAAELFPESLTMLRLLAYSYYMSGDEEKSLVIQEKMMAVRGKAELADFLEKNKDSLATTAEEVLERGLQAVGGREAWESVKTMVMVYSVQSTDGNQPRMVRMYKRPFLYRQGLESGTSFSATDGKTFWRVSSGEWKEGGNLHLRLISMDKWLLNYKDFGISHQFMGFDYFNGSPVYCLRRSYQDGFVEDLYFSAWTNLLTEVRSDYPLGTPFMKSYMTLWNYKDVEGIKIPFIFIRNMGSLEPPHGAFVEEVRINVPLDDNLFLPPDYKKQPPK